MLRNLSLLKVSNQDPALFLLSLASHAHFFFFFIPFQPAASPLLSTVRGIKTVGVIGAGQVCPLFLSGSFFFFPLREMKKTRGFLYFTFSFGG